MKIFGFYIEKGLSFVLLPFVIFLTLFFWFKIDFIIKQTDLFASTLLGGLIHLMLLMTLFMIYRYHIDEKKQKNKN